MLRRHHVSIFLLTAALAACNSDGQTDGDGSGDAGADTGDASVTDIAGDGTDDADTDAADGDAVVDSASDAVDDATDVAGDADTDTDTDVIGCDDADLDTVCDDADLCPGFDDNVDTDEDGVPNGCDECGEGEPDADDDGVADSCDVCADADDTLDADDDGVPDECDVCPIGDDHIDFDRDGVPNACDLCDGADSDDDGVTDTCDICPGGSDLVDSDRDGRPDFCDVCPLDVDNDTDDDGTCDSDDLCVDGDDRVDSDLDLVPDDCDECPLDAADDSDSDGVCDGTDACPDFDDNADSDSDGIADGCDDCPGDNGADADSDGACDTIDLCPGFDDAVDADDDGTPDGCDLCPMDSTKVAPGGCGCGSEDADSDGDTRLDCVDECPDDPANDDEAGPTRFDCNLAPIYDAEPAFIEHEQICDGHPDCSHPALGAIDEGEGCVRPAFGCVDGTGLTVDRVCDGIADCSDGEDEIEFCDVQAWAGDGICAAEDNCPGVFNPEQQDTDGDGAGDACDLCPGAPDDLDTDADGTADCRDVCPGVDDRIDVDGDSVPDCADECPGDPVNDDEASDVEFDCNLVNGGGFEPVWIPRSALCDGVSDCPSSPVDPGIDEYCVPEAFSCGGAMIGIAQFCDGVFDCADGTDELPFCRLGGTGGDGICGEVDNCPAAFNPGQEDSDRDSVGDACDICPGSDDADDLDRDTVPDCVDQCPGADDLLNDDGDAYPDCLDPCPGDDLNDEESDGPGTFPCSLGWMYPDPTMISAERVCDGVADCAPTPIGVGADEDCELPAFQCMSGEMLFVSSVCDGVADCMGGEDEMICGAPLEVGDGLCGAVDNCALNYNPSQVDSDEDGAGDACDLCAGEDDYADSDSDGVADCVDRCAGISDSADPDRDGMPDCVEACPGDPNNDGETGPPMFDCNFASFFGGGEQPIPNSALCDGVVDCPTSVFGAGADEICDGSFVMLPDDCDMSIPLTFYCDGVGDCANFADEKPCLKAMSIGDGYCFNDDNCPLDYNPGQEDDDLDAVGDRCDQCPGSDDSDDADSDGVSDCIDICPGADDFDDADRDGVVECLDPCPGDAINDVERGAGRLDCNFSAIVGGEPVWVPATSVCDGLPDCPENMLGVVADEWDCGLPTVDLCEVPLSVEQLCDGVYDCRDGYDETVLCGEPLEPPGDGFCGKVDNCPWVLNADQADTDGDGVGDVCDQCPGEDDLLDSDDDGAGDCVDVCPGENDFIDTDRDGIVECLDACPGDAGNDEEPPITYIDCSLTGAGPFVDRTKVCDGEIDCAETGYDEMCSDTMIPCGVEEWVIAPQLCDGLVDCGDESDESFCREGERGDGVCAGVDNCANLHNESQDDTDHDGAGDACDICPGEDDFLDENRNRIADCVDPCVGVDPWLDSDFDSAPDCLDPCPYSPFDDGDGDGLCDDDPADACTGFENESPNTDGDRFCDDMDRCLAGDDDVDNDWDGTPDACDQCSGFPDNQDFDGDRFADACDNCASIWNADQADSDPVYYAGAASVPFGLIAGSATVLSLGDDDVVAQPLGFEFSFYGRNYDTLYVSSNGVVSVQPFIDGMWETHDLLATSLPVIALIWADLNPAVGGAVYADTFGEAPNRTFVLTYSNVPLIGVFELVFGSVTMQLRLTEGSSRIEIQTDSGVVAVGNASQGVTAGNGQGVQFLPGRNNAVLEILSDGVVFDTGGLWDGVGDACDRCFRDSDRRDSDFDSISDCFDVCPGSDDRVDNNGNSIPDCLEVGGT